MSFHRYVALGDSFTEGVGDHDPDRPNGVRGWADRVAEVLATRADPFGYANLAIRGRKMAGILAEQLGPALDLRPDLVTVYAGANDILRPKVDVDAVVAAYDGAVGRLTATGATVVLFTGFDLGFAPVFRHLRGRVATYNELVREVADTHGATLVDYWRLREYRDPRLWDVDRMHMSSAGHQRMAVAVLDTLGVEHDLRPFDLAPLPQMDRRQKRNADLAWARAHAAPWVQRRLRGTSSGDGLPARYPTLTELSGAHADDMSAGPVSGR
ncbi:MAG: SGNH/GDSL hydrolase family protein [Nocardioidaceae bacterium]|nr:SGNH/GDSL hydrolase family protein [Nocardioidaceae bacterium]NUS50504.1 SGNH/GDSL hydrolase family protein [Nocardioidaceae bacterium]